jgi:hypothetical protein
MVQNFLNKQELVVPTADVATNVYAMDVIGNKSDTVAGTSVVAIEKQNAAAIAVIDGFQDVPAQNSSDNNQMRDVIGNKTDTVAGNSIYTMSKSLDGTNVQKSATITGNGATKTNLFTITGLVEILRVIGVVTAVTDATTFSTIYFDSYDGAATTDLTLAAGVDMSGTSAGSFVIRNGAAAVAANHFKNDQVRSADSLLSNPVLVSAKSSGTTYLRFGHTGDANTSVGMMFIVKYRPLSSTAAITAV